MSPAGPLQNKVGHGGAKEKKEALTLREASYCLTRAEDFFLWRPMSDLICNTKNQEVYRN